ncbi:MAG: hypothetical protein GFH27_549325n51 [Chloroflexi bacterium AL-W]|nr:hypothetical protein [Chloroflexi bacterium AL-N1]NOK70099.1 hypothetical protein [Chloroflexi bacterium AL-N10]NOK77889.1 hypothetical protein [Chloroflexi bacterium AL-N5]NOK84898.1 hypothetical protein [Chloroflexi bacterium AL-W]NOK91877.1 hypothetical protein [Chloroflexi bacterium AL-N15]
MPQLIVSIIILLLVIGCSQETQTITYIQPITPLPTPLSPTPATTSLEYLPARPQLSETYPQAILDFLNADVQHKHRLDELLTVWDAEQSVIASPPEGVPVLEDDLDGDSRNDILITLPIPYSGSFMTIYETDNGQYQGSVYTYPESLDATRIWQVADINEDGKREVVIRGNSCGTHTCFLTIIILQWSDDVYRELLNVNQSYATATFRDMDGDDIVELVLEGGTIGSVGAGMQRTQTDVYTWDGQTYQYTATTFDPVASQHPYWQLLDGNTALAEHQYDQAIMFYQKAIAAQPPYPLLNENVDVDVIKAAARFQLMFTYVQLEDDAAVRNTYQMAQQEDGMYATWTKTFIDVYEQNRDVLVACEAAQTVTSDIYLPGYNYATHALGVDGVLCS